ncbi:cytochrome c-type biogenesis protein CcmE [Micromonospora rhizosphaerae]|uniref:Cytochrome c-type biogenesis protein CcmE n=1 Tax=Micromonospora rhizosphaerae TaxID=568872 RepID=A0A1C6STA4_9ACTN|nr:cytochrome c maturation protein CcmE [Micromonospora rhizosphaerae]SCL32874.1 cytochrome c-type biogenesis protein CcmE [Micromonospora rhizosphaerae]
MIRPRSGRIAAIAVVLAAGGVLAASALQDTLTYYRTPAEVLGDPDAGRHRLRLGGEVVPGSLSRTDELVVFRLAEDGHEVTVAQRGVPPETFREGEEAVVEGVLDSDGVFRSDRVLVRHGNEYRPSTGPGKPADAR